MLGSGGDVGDLAALGGDEVGDLAIGEWRLGGWGGETTLETWRLGSGDDVGDLAAGEWRRP